ncbi:DUF6452 family protein [Flavobacterium channae]|uniref:DUF6452 family protein n=1 Tax=Flavobacterium channae TaxID=2897181 RepID=UPI001E497AE0|nr:DUF6452 family protein [Flavobacterium channae]UGS24489.1 DUF6452 family protein [Flavobacterium channae]
MKKIVLITLSTLLALSFWNCEKDDICAEGTPVTPRLIIEFYDATDRTELKNVTDLRVEEFATDNGVVFNENIDETLPARYLSNSNKIAIPLKTFDINSKFDFILNYGNPSENADAVSFSYDKEDIYISRACGYKTIFNLTDNDPNTFPTSGYWIQDIEVIQPNIENENEVHVKIYF